MGADKRWLTVGTFAENAIGVEYSEPTASDYIAALKDEDPAVVWEVGRAIMEMKIAGPWEELDEESLIREELSGVDSCASVTDYTVDHFELSCDLQGYDWEARGSEGKTKTLESAKKAADDDLRAQGYRLVGED